MKIFAGFNQFCTKYQIHQNVQIEIHQNDVNDDVIVNFEHENICWV